MKLFGRDLDREIAVVAEIGVNHEGDVDAASRLIRLAHDAGADAIKLQTYTPERFASAADPVRLERVRRFCLDRAAHQRLAAEAQRMGATLFSTAVTEDVVPLLSELFPAIKIASGDVNFEPVIRTAVATGKPVIISTGDASIDEIDQAVEWARAEAGAGLSDQLAVLHCVSAYPAPMAQANLLSIPFLKQRYGLTTGYSNHVLGPEACYGAVALGAQIIEVHVTDRREGREFRDHALSFEPAELSALIGCVRRLTSALGTLGKEVQESERAIRAAIRKGVVAAHDLAAGAVLTREDLMYARPATEFAAAELPQLIGKRLVTAVQRGQLIPRSGVAGV